MKIGFGFRLFLILGLLAIGAAGQQSTDSGATTGGGDSGATQPAPPDVAPPIAPLSMPSFSVWHFPRGPVSILAQMDEAWDSNILATPADPLSDRATEISLDASGGFRFGRSSFDAEYTPQFERYAHYSQFDYVSQSYVQHYIFQATRHTAFHWNLFAHRFPGRGVLPTINFGPGALMGALLQDQNTVLSGIGNYVDLSHESSENSSWDVYAGELREHYSLDVPALGSAVFPPGTATSNSVGALWLHRLTPHLSLGVNGTVSTFAFSADQTRSRFETVNTVWRWHATPTIYVEATLGPSLTQEMGTRQHLWGYASQGMIERRLFNEDWALLWNRGAQLGQVHNGLVNDYIAARYERLFGPTRLLIEYGHTGATVDVTRRHIGAYFWSAGGTLQLNPYLAFRAGYVHSNEDDPELPGSAIRRSRWVLGLDWAISGHRVPGGVAQP